MVDSFPIFYWKKLLILGPKARYTVPQQYVISPNDKEIFQPRDFADASLRVMLSSNFKPACRMRAAARIIIAARKREAQILLLTDATIDKLAATGGAQTHVNNYQIHVEKRHNCEDEITKDVSNEQVRHFQLFVVQNSCLRLSITCVSFSVGDFDSGCVGVGAK